MTDTKKADEKPVEEKAKAKEEAAKPTGQEHKGEGGRFRIDASGKRVRKPVKQD